MLFYYCGVARDTTRDFAARAPIVTGQHCSRGPPEYRSDEGSLTTGEWIRRRRRRVRSSAPVRCKSDAERSCTARGREFTTPAMARTDYVVRRRDCSAALAYTRFISKCRSRRFRIFPDNGFRRFNRRYRFITPSLFRCSAARFRVRPYCRSSRRYNTPAVRNRRLLRRLTLRRAVVYSNNNNNTLTFRDVSRKRDNSKNITKHRSRDLNGSNLRWPFYIVSVSVYVRKITSSSRSLYESTRDRAFRSISCSHRIAN